jgi:hypothetical protein
MVSVAAGNPVPNAHEFPVVSFTLVVNSADSIVIPRPRPPEALVILIGAGVAIVYKFMLPGTLTNDL